MDILKFTISNNEYDGLPKRSYLWVSTVVFIGGGLLALSIGVALKILIESEYSLWIPISIEFLWVSFYIYCGLEIIENRSYLVVERFGKFNQIAHSGIRILCFPGLIDKIAIHGKGTLKICELVLFSDKEAPYVVDFKGGASAPVRAKSWYHVGPEDGSIGEINKAIYNFTYSYSDNAAVEERIEDVLESSSTPLLQKLTLDEALEQKGSIADEAVNQGVKDALNITGIYLVKKKPFIITDIVLPPDVIKLREEITKGDVEARKQISLGNGYIGTILGIMAAAKKEGTVIDIEYARSLYETQRGLETLEKTGSKISFVSRNMRDVLLTIGVGENDAKTTTGGTS